MGLPNKLKALIKKYGVQKINTLTKYPSILTLHDLAPRGGLLETFTTDIKDEELVAFEKIDGTNVRIITYGYEYLIGARNIILHYTDDVCWNNALGIVEQIHNLQIPIPKSEMLTVIYGELYGGNIGNNSKQYGKEGFGFRVFDVATIPDLSILDRSLPEISAWRESTKNSNIDKSLKYGQSFLSVKELEIYKLMYELVPRVEFDIKDFSCKGVLEQMKKSLPSTKVDVSPTALKNPEGLVLRNNDRSKIVKIRFEDYEKTFK